MFKTNSEIIKIEARTQAEIKTGVTFWSHDRGTAKLIFKLIKDGVPQSIPEGTTVPIRLIFKSKTAQDGFGKHDYLATVEDRVNGIVSIILEDNILGYIGEVKGSIYLDLPGNRSLDTAGRFNFSIQRSPIDDSTPELEDYYFNGFSQTIDKIEEMISQAENRIDGKVDQIESEIEVLEGKMDQAQGTFDRIEDDLKETGKLKKLYSNSIDFGNYDYSGNPNLMNNLDFDKFSPSGNFSIVNKGTGIECTSPSDGSGTVSVKIPAQLPNKKYTLSLTATLDSTSEGALGSSFIGISYIPQEGEAPIYTNLIRLDTMTKGQQKRYSNTMTTFNFSGVDSWRLRIYSPSGSKVKILVNYDIKLESSDVVTPYQPNLLESPWELSNFLSNPDLSDPTKSFPIVNSNYIVYDGRRVEKWEAGKTYTVSMKATKPSSQRFDLYLGAGSVRMGSFTQVEGKVDEWKISFTLTQTNIDAGAVDILRVYQYPSTSLGSCRIDWLKLEDGTVATPLIKEYKYQGLGQTRTSIDKYLWKPFEIKNEFYSNDINFGDHDYSGNPNLAVTAPNTFSQGTGGVVEYSNGEYSVVMDGSARLSKYNVNSSISTPLKEKVQYTLSAEIYVGEDYTGDITQIFANYAYTDGGYSILQTSRLKADSPRNTWIKVKGTSVIDFQERKPKVFYFTWQTVANSTNPTGTLKIRKIKIEEGSEATPYQPNLISDPYRLCRGPISKNLANKGQSFPISTRDYLVYNADMEKDFEAGKTYTVTLKGSKSNVQEFRVYITGQETLSRIGDMSPVVGLSDTWSLTFTALPANLNGSSSPKNLRIYQFPQSTVGAVTIEDLKIEENDRFTQNISNYKYRGVNNFVSKNPKDYTWDINNDYIQQVFDDTVSLTKPQTIISSKNFEEVPTVKNQPIHYGPQLFEGWYGSGEEHAGMGTKARLRVGGLVVDGRDQLSEPFTWNSGRYEATVNRDITFYCKGTMFVEMGGNIGKYIYIANWKNSEQTQYASGMPAGAGTNLDGGLYYRNMLDFSWIVQLKQGDKFSIGIELADGKTVSKIQIRTLHIKELVSPIN